MLKKKYIKRLYIEEAVCNKCGSIMEPTGAVFASYPEQYPYVCPKCGWQENYRAYERPGAIRYEFEDKENV
jgi:RNase P subunit RPR2